MTSSLRIVPIACLALAGATLSLGGCSSDNQNGLAGAAQVGLTVAPGVTLSSASYTVTGPGGFSRTGTINIANSTTLSTTVGGLPAGAGYSIVVTATAGGISCTGTAAFAVAAHATASVTVQIRCLQAPRTGSIQLDGKVNLCPQVADLSANPAEVSLGGTIALAAAGLDVDSRPSPLSYQWTMSAGTLSSVTVANPTFTCTSAGPATVTVTVSDGDCTDSLSATITCTGALVPTLYASVETDPVPHAGDAADDPAIWINPANPALSTIIGTDKTAMGGLGVYDLTGHQIQFVSAGALNNVDLRSGFPLGGSSVTLVTAGNRNDNSIAIFKIDPATRLLSNAAARVINTLTVYGSCMYHSPITGKFYYFVDSKAGAIEQWELFDNGAGLVDAVKVRNLPPVATQPEACVVDDELGLFYIGEEDVGIWKYNAEPGTPDTAVLVDGTGPGGHLVADVEGLAIAKTGPGTGFLLASNQGDSTFAMYKREGANAYVKTFRVGSSMCIDEVSGSDGIEVTTASLGPGFPSGAFLTQDDTNDGGTQNFKLVPWQDIVNGYSPAPVCSAPMTDAGAPPPVAQDAGAGFPAAFCASFCGKCAGCWNPAAGFSEGDCLYKLAKPNFSLDDCLAGCAAGATPGFPPSQLVPNWQSLECLAFDDSM